MQFRKIFISMLKEILLILRENTRNKELNFGSLFLVLNIKEKINFY